MARKSAKAQSDKVIEMPAMPAEPDPGVAMDGQGDVAVEVPTFTLRADRRRDLLALVAIRDLCDVPETVIRAFEQYEERYMR